MKSRETYEIIAPEDVGVDQSSIVLTARSGRAALKHHLKAIGYTPDNDELDAIYQRFLELADKKKDITTRDLEVLAGSEASRKTPRHETGGVAGCMRLDFHTDSNCANQLRRRYFHRNSQR